MDNSSYKSILLFLTQIFQNDDTRSLFPAAARTVPPLVFKIDIDPPHITAYNDSKLTALLGIEPAALPGIASPLQFIYSEDQGQADDQLKVMTSLADGEIYCFQTRLQHAPDHSWRAAQLCGTVLTRHETGSPASYLLLVQEIAPKMLEDPGPAHEPDLVGDEESFLKQGTWETNLLNGETHWSKGMFHIFGYDSGEAVPETTVSSVLHQAQLTEDELLSGQQDWDRVLEDRDNYVRETSILTLQGKHKYLETYGRIFRNKAGIAEKVIGTTRDITSLQEYKKDLEGKINELNRQNTELEGFAYIASHDLQEPLRKLTAFSERLQLKFADKLGDEGRLYLDRMAAATENMRILIDDLLEFSRTARSDSHFSTQNLSDIFQAAQSDLEVKIEESGARIEAPVLPTADVIPGQIKRLFVNLLSNSIKFKKHAEPPVITITCKRLTNPEKKAHGLKPSREFFELLFRDNGIGFEKEYAEKIFQLFQRLHGKHEYPGSGIGLAICKKIVENHGGLLYATGAVNQGSIFTVILPDKQF